MFNPIASQSNIVDTQNLQCHNMALPKHGHLHTLNQILQRTIKYNTV